VTSVFAGFKDDLLSARLLRPPSMLTAVAAEGYYFGTRSTHVSLFLSVGASYNSPTSCANSGAGMPAVPCTAGFCRAITQARPMTRYS